MTKNEPIKKFRIGNVSADVWENEGKENKKFLSISIAKNYKDMNDEWKSTNSFSVSDLPKLVLASSEAYRFCYLEHKTEKV